MVGNLPNFTKIDVFRCLLKIEEPISRSKLSEILDLGEGTIRSILDILKKNNLSNSDKKGHFASKKGSKLINEIKNSFKIEKIDLKSILPDKKKIAVCIRQPKKLQKAYELRDTAVKNGADGALILEYDKKLTFYEQGMDKDYDFSEIENIFDLNKNDLVIIAYADSFKLAEYGALAAALELNSLKNIMAKLN